ncbi:Spore maturation protein CgeB [Jeotgalicoccus aerolatus]|uniref:Spore maturation protein CgeB n=1 Tax=Jeotgalicoccus aerolatus TaxID=709510 RepID=A0A1G8WFZ9_9STAP|nr:glycosyltransferase [Jeotgalicoccus aerolatus]SDJ77269.1 Spore maturation protein CgeB [Jeotgalicoccus aerolatus]
MDYKKFEKQFENYSNDLEENFSMTLNKIINELDSSILANEYNPKATKFIPSDPFYQLKFEDMGRDKALDKYEESIQNISKSNGSRFFKKINLNIGIVCDEFLFNSFKDVANFEYISRDNPIIKDYDFVIFASSWRGIDNSWEGVAHPNDEKRNELINLIEEFNQKNIPTIFYSKEDPVNFHLFKSIAAHCKFIFTTALESVKDYISYTENNNVNVLQFGINPLIHNPVGTRTTFSGKFKNDILFAGSWLNKYPVRMSETKKLFNAIQKENAPFTIIDRNYNLGSPRYQFPSRYLQHLAKPIPHNQLMKLHKVIRWSINMNSVKYSQTMFANRVYELQAFGNILLSNYNTGINNLFPNIRIINTGDDFNVIYNTSEKDLQELQAKGIRNVFKEHTTFDRIQQITTTIGMDIDRPRDRILVVLNNNSELNVHNFNQQLFSNKTMVLESELSSINLDEYDFITYFNDKYIYEEYHLDDLFHAFKYTDVDFVTKDNSHEAHNYISILNDKYKSMIDVNIINNLDEIETLTDGYNLDYIEILPSNENSIVNTTVKELSVIVPIHNNGTYLEEKCFASLKRSSSFEKMEIIFINDGSTDDLTMKVINRLRRRHPDIVYIENPTGSGSASKPRNQGARIASTNLITYLDPDNEALGDGYHYLLEQFNENEVDMVVGNIIKEDNSRKIGGKYTDILKRNNNGKMLVTDPHEFLVRSDLRVQSIQALIVKKSVILDNDIKMVEGAAGQDTMFYQELVLNSKAILGVNKYIHVYYAAVLGSVTNTISHKFFDKYYKLEIERIPYLQKYGLMDIYLDVRFNSYIRAWYLLRLDRVDAEHREAAIKRFLDIIHLYDQFNPEFEDDIQIRLNELENEINYSGK